MKSEFATFAFAAFDLSCPKAVWFRVSYSGFRTGFGFRGQGSFTVINFMLTVEKLP